MGAEVRPVADSRVLDELAEILGQAFAFPPPEAARWFDRAGVDQLRVAHDAHGEVVGGLLRIPMGQWVGGRSVPMVGIAGVGVRIDRRRQGVATDLLRAVLRELRDQGVAASGLYASNQALYRGMGWEHAAGRYVGTMSPRDIDLQAEDTEGIEIAEDEHRDDVAAVYREHAAQRAGFLDRGKYIWQRNHQPFDGGVVRGVVFRDVDGRVEAYVYSRIDRLPDGGQRLEVVDCASRTSQGWARIWSHLRDGSTLIDEVRLVTAPTDPMYLALRHPRLKVRFQEPYLLRLVDVRAALQARGWHGPSERVVLRIVDPVLGDHTLTLDASHGEAEVTTGGDPTAHVHVRALSGLFTGHLSAYEAHTMGLVDAGTRSLSALQSLFSGPAPWLRDFF